MALVRLGQHSWGKRQNAFDFQADSTMATPDQWLRKLTSLKVDKARGDPAPHKPLLLLVVLELAELGELPAEVLPLTPELAFRFCTYSSIVAHRRTQRPDIRFPFHHLKSDGVWSPLGCLS